MSARSIPLDVLVQAVEALRITMDRMSIFDDNRKPVVAAWGRLSWRVEEMTAAVRVEVVGSKGEACVQP